MLRRVAWLIGAGALLAVSAFDQSVSDPFTQFGGLVVPGRIQRMVASRDYLIVHRVVRKDEEIIECWVEGQLTLGWRKTFVSVDGKIVLEGDRVAVSAAETDADLQVHRASYLRGPDRKQDCLPPGGHPGAHRAFPGHLGRSYRGHGGRIDRLRPCLLFPSRPLSGLDRGQALAHGESCSPIGTTVRPVLYDPVAKADLWAGRIVARRDGGIPGQARSAGPPTDALCGLSRPSGRERPEPVRAGLQAYAPQVGRPADILYRASFGLS